MIKAVIFDFGGVLVRTQDWQPRQRLDKQLGLPEGGSYSLVFGEMSIRAQMGEITSKELWNWIGSQINLDAKGVSEFRNDFFAGDVLDDELLLLIRSLRQSYQTALLSNAVDELRQILGSDYGISDAFDLIVCSAEEKVMKPSPEIYKRTIDRLGCLPNETVFIDDALENIEGAKRLGLNTIHFNERTNVASELSALGVQTGGKQ